MRTRKEIEEVQSEVMQTPKDEHSFTESLILEVLLDIRDLLSQ